MSIQFYSLKSFQTFFLIFYLSRCLEKMLGQPSKGHCAGFYFSLLAPDTYQRIWDLFLLCYISGVWNRWVSVMEFHDPTLIIGKVFGQESTVVKWNYQILGLHPVTVCQKVPILDFQSEFSMSKIIQIFLKKKFIEEYQSRRTFFVKSIFCWLQFLNHFITKMTPNFWRTVTGWRPKIW